MPGQIKRQDRETVFGEPQRERAPTGEVASLVVDQDRPAVCLTCALAAQNDFPRAYELSRRHLGAYRSAGSACWSALTLSSMCRSRALLAARRSLALRAERIGP